MQPYFTLVRRELGTYFVSFTGYTVIAAVLFLLGLSLTLVLKSLNSQASNMPVIELFYQTAFFWVILLIASPIITMRSFAQEKNSGTFETLMTTPVSDLQVVLAKFTGTMIFYLIVWLPLLAYPWLLRHYTIDKQTVESGAIASTFLGIFLIGSLYMSLGCFASSLTRNQIVAAMNAFVLGICLFLFSFLSRMAPPKTSWQTKVLAQISMLDHMHDFVRGLVDLRAVVFYVSLTVLFLYLTLRVVESRRWK